MKKSGLGKGLDALIPSYGEKEATSVQHKPIELSLSEIQKNPYQPRIMKDDEKLIELSNSIKVSGVIQPVLVRKITGGYQLVAGERRYRASQLAGKTTIPAVIIEVSEDKLLEYAIIENVQRENLNPIEEAAAYDRLQTEFGLTQDEIAEKVAKNRTTVTNSLRLLKLPKDMQEDVASDKISAGHARAILSLENPILQKKLKDAIINRGLSVRQAEALAKDLSKNINFREKIKISDPAINDIENKLINHFGVKTKIKPRTKSSGRIEIFYNNLDEFEKILEVLRISVE